MGDRASLSTHVRRRRALVAAAVSCAIGATVVERALSHDADDLAAELSEAAGATVRSADIRWEPSGGAFSDLFLGRLVLFLGSEVEGAPRDVFRARVRVSPEGRLLGVSGARNLTSTPVGDDHALVVRGHHAAYATFAFGQEQSVTLLDLSGEGAQNATQAIHDRAMAWVTNVQQTSSGAGVGRVDVTLDQPASRVGLELVDRGLEISLADDDRAPTATRRARLDFESGELASAVNGLHTQQGRHLPKRFVFWAVDTVRAVPWIGPAPIAWLEEKTFAVRDSVRQALYKFTSGSQALAEPAQVRAAAPSVLDGSLASEDVGRWPPPPVRSIWKTPEAGEGEWVEPSQPWLKRLPKVGDVASPPPFYRTFVRPDEERPYSSVILVAMDMRQLDLDMEAGTEDPKPATGPPGAGRIPRDPATYTRVAAAFNGGFKTEHGSYGMMLRKRVLLPPSPGAATVIITKDGHVGMGSWGQNHDIGGIVGVENSDILSFRQNLDPLVDNDKVNPLGRWQWGFTLPGTSMQTERSGICITNAGHLLYAWGDDVSATVLGKAMNMAGCIYGMHLDMNPYHTGFIFTNITDFKSRAFNSELLSKDMAIAPDRYISYAPKDFFFVTLRDPKPTALEGAAWEPDPGMQPAPAFIPGLWRAKESNVELFDVEPQRATFRVRAGTAEPETRGDDAKHELDADDASRVLFALSMGTTESKHHRGLGTDGHLAVPMSGGNRTAVLVASEDGALSIGTSRDFAIPAHADAVELPLLVDEGVLVPQTGNSRQNAALCVSKEGRLLVGRGASAEDVGKSLMRAGCTRAVLLDRGAGNRGVLFRTGTSNPPRAQSTDTVLFAMGKPLMPRGFRFEPSKPVEPPKKK